MTHVPPHAKGSFNISWYHLIFILNFIIYIVQLYKEDCAILQIC